MLSTGKFEYFRFREWRVDPSTSNFQLITYNDSKQVRSVDRMSCQLIANRKPKIIQFDPSREPPKFRLHFTFFFLFVLVNSSTKNPNPLMYFVEERFETAENFETQKETQRKDILERHPSTGPPGCEDDFECNDGKANFPLQCCEMPLLGKFCCEPPDDFATGTPTEMPAYVPLPVPVDESPK